jgi:hypothetical protein
VGLRKFRNRLVGLSGQEIVQWAGVDLRLILGQRTRADGGPSAVEVAGETRRDQVGRIGRSIAKVSMCEDRVEGCLCLLLHSAYAVAQDCSQFLNQMGPVSRLFQLLDGCDDDIIADALGVDCMHCLSSRGWWRSVLGQS